jgi:hypothetical protein
MNKINITESDFKIDVEDKEIPDEHQVETCCSGTSDKRCHTLIVQTTISISVLFLCIFKLADHNLNCEQSNIYVGLLTMLIGIWIKSPLS